MAVGLKLTEEFGTAHDTPPAEHSNNSTRRDNSPAAEPQAD